MGLVDLTEEAAVTAPVSVDVVPTDRAPEIVTLVGVAAPAVDPNAVHVGLAFVFELKYHAPTADVMSM